MNNRSLQGFTLSELLVSLAVLGLIAAFAIPKVLTAVGESSARAIGNEMVGMISEAYQAERAANNGNISRGTTSQMLVDRMNYSTVITTTANGATTGVQMQNGAQLGYAAADTFADGAIGVMGFWIDPDGAGAASTPVTVYLGGDGRIFPALSVYGAGTGTAGNTFATGTIYAASTAANATVTAAAAGPGTTWFRN